MLALILHGSTWSLVHRGVNVPPHQNTQEATEVAWCGLTVGASNHSFINVNHLDIVNNQISAPICKYSKTFYFLMEVDVGFFLARSFA